ncbi:bacterial regulatory, tetR family protein [Rhodococcus sp. MTM3W5.2]|uniref:TetR family transcriptional regulator n=1 Tax=Rhodococcus sp. MTM3W5.2 TaxID=1805827 RepID=UPI00097915D0|nr:TetR family transcriptional regulator [Rhodococcus sp. MTM3W5.2]AQA22332.1 bacterial regulatory, tetR family protein [Rhodococcus sp. MTM3W5.2]
MKVGEGLREGSAPHALMRAAEVLIAEAGIDVPLQDIARAAGQRNKSAVQYHFGSRDGLIAAIVEYHLRGLEFRRMELLAECEGVPGGDDLLALLKVLALPLIEVVDQPGSTHFARFFERVRHHRSVADEMNLDGDSRPTVRIVMSRLDHLIGDLPAVARRYRLESLATVLLALIADYERMSDADHRGRPEPDDVIDLLFGLLTAAHSSTTV